MLTRPYDYKQAEKNFPKLPRFAYGRLPTDGKSILIKRGETGYWPTETPVDVDAANERLGITKAQAEAMMVGSVFGFDVPGADPDTYDENGDPR